MICIHLLVLVELLFVITIVYPFRVVMGMMFSSFVVVPVFLMDVMLLTIIFAALESIGILND